MDLRSLTASIAARQAAAEADTRRLKQELTRVLPPAPFAGALAPGSFHTDLAGVIGAPGNAAVRSVKLPFTVVFQPPFKPAG